MDQISVRRSAAAAALPLSVLLIGHSSVTQAMPLYSNGVTKFDSYVVSQPSAQQLVWDDFQLSSAVAISGIQWTGTYSMYTPQADNFYIQIFADSNGAPAAAPLYTLPFADSVNRSAKVANSTPGNSSYIFDYGVSFAPIALSAGAYWLSIYDDLPVDIPTSRWAWVHQFNLIDGNEVIKNTLNNFSAHYSYSADFTLTGTTAVPIPSPITLLGLGVASIIGGLRAMRHQKAPC